MPMAATPDHREALVPSSSRNDGLPSKEIVPHDLSAEISPASAHRIYTNTAEKVRRAKA